MASITCGKCKGKHGSTDEVRACYAGKALVTTPAAPAATQPEGLAFLTEQAPVAASAMSVVSASPAFHQSLGHQRPARPSTAATPAQERFIRTLDGERAVPVAGATEEEAFLIARLEDVLGGGKFVSTGEASRVITWLKTLPVQGSASKPTSSPAQPATAQPLPDVPEGHYAVASRTGNNDLDFFRVDRPTEGRWTGRTFVKRVIGGKPDHPVRGAETRLALEAIVAAGVEASAVLYGQEIGRCYRCNRHLTDETSRALGIGPDCRSK